MRLGQRWIGAVAVLATLGCGDKGGSTGPSGNLQGTWTATKWEYVNQANTSQKVTAGSLGATVTLAIAASTYTITYTIPGLGTQTVSGTYTTSGNTFIITENGSSDPEHVTFSFSNGNNTLTMTDTETNYDFDSDGTDEPATLNMVLTRQ